VALYQAGQQSQARQFQRASTGRGSNLHGRSGRGDFVACDQHYPAGMQSFSVEYSRGA
jgi:hypothetical protein